MGFTNFIKREIQFFAESCVKIDNKIFFIFGLWMTFIVFITKIEINTKKRIIKLSSLGWIDMKISFPSRLLLVLIINSESLFNDAKKNTGALLWNTKHFELQFLSLQDDEFRRNDLHPVKFPKLYRNPDCCIPTWDPWRL